MRDYHRPGRADVLTSTLYVEGFGQGAYSRVDAYAYQGLVTSIIDSELPFVLPRYEYSFVGEPDALGGRTSVQAGAFNVWRPVGTDTRRANLSLNWERPATGALGDLWKLVLHLDSAAYDATNLNMQPSWGAAAAAASAQAMPTAALEGRWPLMRSGWGTQVIEPIVQLIAAPNGSSYGLPRSPTSPPFLNTLIPNEDSFDFEFTDANLFALNRFPGVDRLEGGPRANVALHGTWYFGAGQTLDALIGQGYRASPDRAFPVGSGLDETVTDVVSHLSYTPNQYFDVTSRQRFSHRDFNLRFFDALASAGPSWLKFNAGYIYEKYNPFTYYDTVPTGVLTQTSTTAGGGLTTTPINEITFGVNTNYGHWRVGGFIRRDLESSKMVDAGANVTYEDECLILSANYFRRYTSIDFDNGATILLFQITLKTIGTFGFNGL
jgi:LPS-assembly protein